MPRVKITLLGAEKFARKLKSIANASSELDRAVLRGARMIEGEAKRNISRGARSGRVYKKGEGRFHVASAPGEFPKTDTGELVANITTEKVKQGVYEVGSRAQAPQGYYLETKAPQDGGRPWLRPTVKQNAKRFFDMIDKSYKKILRG